MVGGAQVAAKALPINTTSDSFSFRPFAMADSKAKLYTVLNEATVELSRRKEVVYTKDGSDGDWMG